jgi:uncharacterized protein (TIGR03067 family)
MLHHFPVALLACLVAVNPGSAGESRRKELAKLDGTWTLVKMEIDGKSLLDKARPFPNVVIKDGKATFDGKEPLEGGPVLLAKVLDTSRKPRTVTVPYEGKVAFYGIYEVTGDELRVCGDGVDTAQEPNPEARRPKEFDSKQGLLLVFKRQRK